MSIAINNNFQRDQLVATFNGQVLFPYTFPIFSDTYLTVYKRAGNATPDDATQKLVLGVDYTVQDVGSDVGGTITLTVGATIGDIVTLVGTQPIERLSLFADLNPFTVSLNQQLNDQTVMQEQTYTYWANLTPHYNFDELVSAPSGFNAGVRPFKLILPMLPDRHTWVGRGSIGTIPDDITTLFIGGIGTGNVLASGPGMRPSIVLWTGTDFIVTDSDLNIAGALIEPTAGIAEDVGGWSDTWGAMHWPAHDTAGRPIAPSDGDTYYDTILQQFFGYENGAWVAFSTGGAGGDDLIRRTVNQPGHGFIVGQYVYATAVSGVYGLTNCNNTTTAELEGLVVQVIDVDNFVLQVIGWVDGVFNALTPGSVYYMDSTNGNMSLNPPVTNGFVNLPVFWAVTATQGWLRHSRGFIVGGGAGGGGGGSNVDSSSETVVQPGNVFSVGDWIYCSADDTYDFGDASTLTTSQVEWVVTEIIIPNNTFVIQQSGKITGVVTFDDVGNPIASGQVYYLSDTQPGLLSPNPPVTLGHYNKPLYVQTDLATSHGWIMEQKPTIISAPLAAGSTVLLGSFTINPGDTFIDTGANFLDGTYTDIKIVGRGITGKQNPGVTHVLSDVKMRVYTNGVLRSAAYNYRPGNTYNYWGGGAPIWYDAYHFRTGYGATYPGGTSMGTIDGGCLEFESVINNANSTDVYKIVQQKNMIWATSTQGPASGPPVGPGAQMITTLDPWLYIGDLQAITGFRIFLDFPIGANTDTFLSGEISIYGTVA